MVRVALGKLRLFGMALSALSLSGCGNDTGPKPEWVIGRWSMTQGGNCHWELMRDGEVVFLTPVPPGGANRWYLVDGSLWLNGIQYRVERNGEGQMTLSDPSGRVQPTTFYRC